MYITVGDGGNIEQVDIFHADDLGQCPSPADSTPEYGGVCAFNFTSGPAAGKYCWDRQPEWSALRDSSFGHGILEVMTVVWEILCDSLEVRIYISLMQRIIALKVLVNCQIENWS